MHRKHNNNTKCSSNSKFGKCSVNANKGCVTHVCGRAFDRPISSSRRNSGSQSWCGETGTTPRFSSASGAGVEFLIRRLTVAARAMSAPAGAALETAAVKDRRDSTVAAEVCAARAAAVKALSSSLNRAESKHPQISCSRSRHGQSYAA